MTIVTKNSLTLSNINDGTITHYAYAYSADGMDRFTTVYPNLNLLQGTNAQAPINSNWKDIGGAQISLATDEKAFISSLTPSSSAQVGLWQEGVTATIGATYTISAFVKNMSSYAFQDFRLTLVTRGNSTNVYPKSFTIPNDNQYHYISFSYQVTATDVKSIGAQFYVNNAPSNVQTLFRTKKPKLEPGSVATPYMQSASEVTTADWPSYIGQYTDFTQADSTNPSDYTWSLIRGNDGADGQDGKNGTNGKDGNPGKVVSDTEPTTRFKGLTWKYSGTADLTASDGTVINPNTEYYYNGTHWMINYLSANNLEANSITADLIDAKNLTITDGEFSSTIIDGPVQIQTEIKDDHLLIYKMDTSHNEIHTIALKSDSGLGMTYQNSDTGEYTSAGVNFQGLFMQNNITNEFARLTPQGTKLSTDVPWTILSPLGGFSGGLIRFAVKNGVAHFSLAGLSCPPMTAGNWIKCAQLPSGSIAIPSENQVTAAFTNATVWGFYVSKSGGLYLQSTSNSPALNGLVNASNSYPIG